MIFAGLIAAAIARYKAYRDDRHGTRGVDAQDDRVSTPDDPQPWHGRRS